VDTVKSKIFQVLWNLKKSAYSKFTIRNCYKALNFLGKHSDLDNPESVKDFIADLERTPSWKKVLCTHYSHYAKLHNLPFEKPRYKPIPKLPKIPLEDHINYIILNSSRKYSSAFSVIRDTGVRPIECARILVKDIDFNKKTITVRTAKDGTARIVKIKDDTIARLREYIGIKELGQNDKLYPSAEILGKMWRVSRKRAVRKTKLAELENIRLYDLRHYKATMLYNKTKDILYVKYVLGHKRIDSTLQYTQLISFKSDEWTIGIAKTVQEACELIDKGFEYVTEIDNNKLFKKRK
jgi:integrase